VFGPWSGHGGGGPSNVVRTAMRNALAGEEAVIPAAGMEWVYSKDAAMGTVQALRAKELGSGVFNVTMGSLTSPEDMAAALKAAVPGARVRVETPTGTAVSMPNMRGVSDLSLAAKHLGYKPQYDMAAGLKDLAGWMRGRNAPW
jgi:nucleoside-diphosphate-sugar epimerase